MTAAWMLYGTIVGLIVAFGARAAEALARLVGYPVRWIWAGALAATVALVLAAPFRSTPSVATAVNVGVVEPLRESVAPPSWIDRARGTLEDARRAALEPLDGVVSMARRLPPSMRAWFIAVWVVLSAAVALVFVGVHARVRRQRRGWPLADVHGVRVRVAPNSGPAVVGLARPEIVVPRWLLGRNDDEQRLVVAHEAEHVRMRDPLLLAFGCLAIAIVPWNLAVWWMFERLRLAVELDCDARVLRGEVAPRSYGELLINLAEHGSGLRVGAPALVGDTSHLHQRLMAMQRPIARFALARGGVAGVLALGALVVACETRLPTSAEVQKMDVATAERAATAALLVRGASTKNYVIDGRIATVEEAHELRPEQIGTVEIVRDALTSSSVVRIRTAAAIDSEVVTVNGLIKSSYRRPSSAKVVEESAGSKHAVFESQVVAESAAVVTARQQPGLVVRTAGNGLKTFTGIVLVDGVRVDPDAIKQFDLRSIASVEVIKGRAALRMIDDPRAVDGIIKIETLGGTGRRP